MRREGRVGRCSRGRYSKVGETGRPEDRSDLQSEYGCDMLRE